MWLKRAILVIFVLVAIACVAVVLDALCNSSYVKAGIATLQFDFDTDSLLPDSLPLPERDFLDTIESVGQSATSAIPDATSAVGSVVHGAATKAESVATAAATKFESAATAAATAITNISSDIEANIPKNISLGTGQICAGFADRTTCDDLPLTLSDIVPKDVLDFLRDHLDIDFQPLDDALSILSGPHIKYALIIGLVLLFLIVTFFFCTLFDVMLSVVWRRRVYCRVLIYFAITLVCCIPFVIAVAALFSLRSKVSDLPDGVKVQTGDVTWLCASALGCAIVMMLLTTAAPALTHREPADRQEIRSKDRDEKPKYAHPIQRDRIRVVQPEEATSNPSRFKV